MPNGVNTLGSFNPYSALLGSGSSGGGGLTNNAVGGAGMPNLQNLLKALQQGSDQANAASNDQYNNLINTGQATSKSILGKGGYFSQAGKALSDTGVQGQNRINEAATQQLGSGKQDLINRGLYSTSALDSKNRAVGLDKERATQELQSGLAGQKANLQVQQAGAAQQLGGLNMAAILSKQNQGPDMGMYMQLIQQLMQGGGGRTNSFSNMGSINSLNKPMTGSGASTFGGYQAPAAQQGGYINGGSAANNPGYSSDVTGAMAGNGQQQVAPINGFYSGIDSRPGDRLFGGY